MRLIIQIAKKIINTKKFNKNIKIYIDIKKINKISKQYVSFSFIKPCSIVRDCTDNCIGQ